LAFLRRKNRLNQYLNLYMVKCLTLIFAFYMLLLPCLSCRDADEQAGHSQTQQTITSGHPENTHDKEACNPFCACNCCGHSYSPSSLPGKMVPKPFLTAKKQRFFERKGMFSSAVAGNIWQPPQLG